MDNNTEMDLLLDEFSNLLHLNYNAIELYNKIIATIDDAEDRDLLLQCKKNLEKHVYKIKMLYKKYLPTGLLLKNYNKDQIRINLKEKISPVSTAEPKYSFVEEELNKYFF